MKGLLYKEICMLKAQMKIWFFVLAVLGGYSFMFHSLSFLFVFMTVIGVMTGFTSFSYDRMYHCDEYVAVMPVSRKEIVLSKYYFLLGLDLFMGLTSSALVFVSAAHTGENMTEQLAYGLGILGATVFLQMVELPIIYLFGSEKARIIFAIIFILPCLALGTLKDNGFLAGSASSLGVSTIPLILAAILVTAFISVHVSISSYRKKEF